MFSFIIGLITVLYGIFACYCFLFVPNFKSAIIHGMIISYLLILPFSLFLYYFILQINDYFKKPKSRNKKKSTKK